MKVNVWQVGYTTQRDYVLRENAQCREKGYVEIPSDTEDWEEEAWHLLNWSCWNYDDNGNAVKPDNVHSPLDHCNSDIVVQIEGTNTYKAAMFIGWKTYNSLEIAIDNVRNNDLWPFSDIRSAFRSGYTMVRNGKAYWQSIEDGKADKENWIEITW